MLTHHSSTGRCGALIIIAIITACADVGELSPAAHAADAPSLTIPIDRATHVALSPDGATLAVQHGETLSLINTADGAVRAELEGLAGRDPNVIFTLDGKYVICQTSEGYTWRAPRAESTPQPRQQPRRKGKKRKGKQRRPTPPAPVATAEPAQMRYGPLTIWDAASGQPHATFNDAPSDVMRRISGEHSTALAPDGSAVLMGTPAGHVLLWPLGPDAKPAGDAMLTPVRYADPGGTKAFVTAVAFSSDGRAIATGDHYGKGRLHMVIGDEIVALPLDPQVGNRVHAMAFSPDGRTLAMASSGRDPDAPSGRGGRQPAGAPTRSVPRSPDIGVLTFWTVSTGPLSAAQRRSAGLLNAVFHSDKMRQLHRQANAGAEPGDKPGSLVVTQSVSEIAYERETRSASPAVELKIEVIAARAGASPEPIGRGPHALIDLLRYASHASTAVYVTNFRIPDSVAQPMSVAGFGVWDERARRANMVYTAHYDLPSPRPRAAVKFDQPITALAFSPDGRTLAVGGHEGLVLTDVRGRASGKPLHTGRVHSVAFSADGSKLVAGAETVMVWDMEN